MRKARITVFILALAAVSITAYSQKGGENETGPYDLVANWPQNPCGDGHQIGSVGGVWAESADRVFVYARGCLPVMPPASGIVPDLIFSPHGIPSRMTISHLIEMLAGKVGALKADFVDGTIFSAEPEDRLRQELLRLGFRENGVEMMYNGHSGEAYQAKIFIGDMYYLKLKHMVANKIHARARGPIQLLTRQPTEGRAKEGGLRLGEMEKDTFVAHGASLLLKERFDSDRTVIPICEECGMVAVHDAYRNKSYCVTCGEGAQIDFIEISYAFKLIMDEMKSLCIYPKLVLKRKW